LAFYKSYRACVRAKVALLRAKQLDDASQTEELVQCRRHLEQADRCTQEFSTAIRPLMLVVHGLPGSGKSTLAAALADQFGAESFSTDSIRRQKFGATVDPVQFNAGIYQRDQRMAIYEEMLSHARQRLKENLSVVLDGAFPWQSVRSDAARIGLDCGAKVLFVHCHCAPEVALGRIARRASSGQTDSETRPEFYAQQLKDEEPPMLSENSISIDTTSSLEEEIKAVLETLKHTNRSA
jgi:predicted kinase